MNSGVIIVGNGTSLLDADRGAEIDAFPTVVRFNDCKLRHFEAFTGTKTDIWFTVMKCYPHKIDELCPQEIIFHSWHGQADKCPYFATYAGTCATKLDHGIIPEMCAFMSDDSYKTWSTGALAIWMMLQRFPLVTLTGFDWWDRAVHHYADNERRGDLHKPGIEKQFIDKLISQGRASFL